MCEGCRIGGGKKHYFRRLGAADSGITANILFATSVFVRSPYPCTPSARRTKVSAPNPRAPAFGFWHNRKHTACYFYFRAPPKNKKEMHCKNSTSPVLFSVSPKIQAMLRRCSLLPDQRRGAGVLREKCRSRAEGVQMYDESKRAAVENKKHIIKRQKAKGFQP